MDKSFVNNAKVVFKVAPTDAISFDSGYPIIDSERCRGMTGLVCVNFCPHNALKIVLGDYEDGHG